MLSLLSLTLVSEVWKSKWADECRCEKESWNTDQLKNTEEKSLRRVSPLIFILL